MSTTEIHTLSLHDALPICDERNKQVCECRFDALCSFHLHRYPRLRLEQTAGIHIARYEEVRNRRPTLRRSRDRKSTRLNSSHPSISYAVFCLKKKIKQHTF